MNTVRVIVTDVGEFKPTPELNAAFDAAKLRRDRQPDMRTKAGKHWRKLFNGFSDEKLREYLSQ